MTSLRTFLVSAAIAVVSAQDSTPDSSNKAVPTQGGTLDLKQKQPQNFLQADRHETESQKEDAQESDHDLNPMVQGIVLLAFSLFLFWLRTTSDDDEVDFVIPPFLDWLIKPLKRRHCSDMTCVSRYGNQVAKVAVAEALGYGLDFPARPAVALPGTGRYGGFVSLMGGPTDFLEDFHSFDSKLQEICGQGTDRNLPTEAELQQAYGQIRKNRVEPNDAISPSPDFVGAWFERLPSSYKVRLASTGSCRVMILSKHVGGIKVKVTEIDVPARRDGELHIKSDGGLDRLEPGSIIVISSRNWWENQDDVPGRLWEFIENKGLDYAVDFLARQRARAEKCGGFLLFAELNDGSEFANLPKEIAHRGTTTKDLDFVARSGFVDPPPKYFSTRWFRKDTPWS